MEGMDWLGIVSGVLGIIAIVFGVKWRQAKKLLKKVSEAMVAVSDAVEDDNVTMEECKIITLKFRDVIDAAIALIRR